MQRDTESGEPLSQSTIGFTPDLLGLLRFDSLELDGPTGAELGQDIAVSADDVGDLGIPPDGLTIGAQDDALAGARHLNGPRPNGFGNHLLGSSVERGTTEPNSHAIALRQHAELRPKEHLWIESIGLIAEDGSHDVSGSIGANEVPGGGVHEESARWRGH